LIFDFDAILSRSFAYRPSVNLPFDAAAVAQVAAILLDTTVYVDQLKVIFLSQSST
jgi:hypothetical protein